MEIRYRTQITEQQICFSDVLESLKENLRTLDAISGSFGKSKTIRNKMNNIVSKDNSGWHRNVKVNPKVQGSKKIQNYIVEYIYDFMCNKCEKKHRILAELCFDNRQAIPANLLKLDMGIRNFSEKVGGKAIGLLICLSESSKKAGKWDNSVGNSEEYELAIDTGHSNYIDSTKMLILEITA